MEILDFYKQVCGRRYYLFDIIDEPHFSKSFPSKWTIGGLFRHILWGIGSLSKYLGGSYNHELMIKTDESESELSTKSNILIALQEADEIIFSLLEETDINWMKSKTKTYYGKEVTREFQLISILCHELEHHGQIRSMFSAFSKMSSSELYGVE